MSGYQAAREDRASISSGITDGIVAPASSMKVMSTRAKASQAYRRHPEGGGVPKPGDPQLCVCKDKENQYEDPAPFRL